MEHLQGKTGFIQPTFDEYPNRYNREKSVYYVPNNQDYSYTVNDLISYFSEQSIDALIVVNPDNPSGNYIPKEQLLQLIEWAEKKEIRLIIDESFADFADEKNNTLIDQKILDANPHLYVMKSISKAYGVPGLRLGVLSSGDKETIAWMKKNVAIWNINSLVSPVASFGRTRSILFWKVLSY